jgi:predicted enzyme related to lactoylglutathione lyase/uncharacterized protein YndB with AHSA1/START domain
MTRPTPVSTRSEVTVAVPREHAFTVFTERFDAWWPRAHYTGPGELAEAVIEPRPGGRWYTRSTDGSEGEWGSVLEWAPPERLVLGWQLDADFHHDPAFLTEVEVTFTALAPNRTHVVLEHRGLERFGADAEQMRRSFGSEGGWTGLLRGFAATAERFTRPDAGDRGQDDAKGSGMAAMTIRTEPWPSGVPCWADLSSPDQATSKAFYSAVLGWEFPPVVGDFADYEIGQRNGAPAAGIGPKYDPAQPTVWTLFLASDDADKTAAAVTEHGGTVMVPPGDVGPLGRMFIAADPAGAVFGVWQAGTHIGAGLVNEPGGITWEDLRSGDPDTARAFYTALFGYDTQPVPMAGPDYTTFSLPGSEAPLGGMGGMMGMEGMPAHWLVYFSVADADAAVAAAQANGGAVIMEPMATPYGRMAGLLDPHGALFWVTQLVEGTPGSGA